MTTPTAPDRIPREEPPITPAQIPPGADPRDYLPPEQWPAPDPEARRDPEGLDVGRHLIWVMLALGVMLLFWWSG